MRTVMEGVVQQGFGMGWKAGKTRDSDETISKKEVLGWSIFSSFKDDSTGKIFFFKLSEIQVTAKGANNWQVL